MDRKRGLTGAELASLDAIITIAQARGQGIADRVQYVTDACLATVHDGFFPLNPHDQEIIRKIRDLAATLEIAPTLGELIEMRGEALRAQG